MDPFRGVNAKLIRAEKHVVELKVGVHEWAKTHPARVVHQQDRNTGWHTLRGEPFPDPPDEWAAVLGELVYGLRAALNQTVELLIRANQQKSERVNQFPIVAKAADAHLVTAQLAGVHPKAVALIDAAQPYHRPNRRDPEPLEIVGALSNEDKHVGPEPVAVLGAPWDQRWLSMAVGQAVTIKEGGYLVGNATPISNTDLVRIRVEPANAVLDMQMQPIPIEVAFGGGALPVRKLGDLVSVVRSVIRPLRPFVTDPPPPG